MIPSLIFVLNMVVLGIPSALLFIPWGWITGDVEPLYKATRFILRSSCQFAGVHIRVAGLVRIPRDRACIFMSNHISNLDPPITLPLIPRRTSVMVKKELFRVPILGKIMLIGSLVPVDRGNRDSGIAAVRDAVKALEQGLNMTIYIEGKRSFDGKLLPFKKGPFYLAEECKVPVVPVTISGTEAVMPKGRFAIRPQKATVTVQFHDPIEPSDFGERDCLMAKVRAAINSGLPAELRE